MTDEIIESRQISSIQPREAFALVWAPGKGYKKRGNHSGVWVRKDLWEFNRDRCFGVKWVRSEMTLYSGMMI